MKSKGETIIGNSIIPIIIIVLLFSAELTAYLKEYVNQVYLEISLYAIVCICMLAYAFRHRAIPNLRNPFWGMLFTYLILLLMRLAEDFVIPDKGFFLYQTSETVIFFYIFPILIPSIFFFVYRIRFDTHKLSVIILLILSICIIKSIYDILNGNANLNNDGRFDTAVFSISMGQYATSIVLVSTFLFFNTPKLIIRLIYPVFAILGFVGVLFSGSRGPFISLLICLIFYICCRIRRWGFVLMFFILLVLFWNVIGELLMSLNEYLKGEGINSFDRVVTTVFSNDGIANHTSGRNDLYSEGLQLFIDNPLFGNSYLIPGKIYVHNILIEQYMATGFVGGTLFLILNVYTISKCIRIIRKEPHFAIIPVLFLQYFIFGCLSVTILALFPYWVFLLLTINKYDNTIMYEHKKKKSISLNRYSNLSEQG